MVVHSPNNLILYLFFSFFFFLFVYELALIWKPDNHLSLQRGYL